MVLKLAPYIIYCGVLLYWQLELDIFKHLESDQKLPGGGVEETEQQKTLK